MTNVERVSLTTARGSRSSRLCRTLLSMLATLAHVAWQADCDEEKSRDGKRRSDDANMAQSFSGFSSATSCSLHWRSIFLLNKVNRKKVLEVSASTRVTAEALTDEADLPGRQCHSQLTSPRSNFFLRPPIEGASDL